MEAIRSEEIKNRQGEGTGAALSLMKLEPAALRGEIRAVTSKSMAHRSLICAALGDRVTELTITDLSVDIAATAECLRSMGAKIERQDGSYRVTPLWDNAVPQPLLNCRESGSTLRFLLPVAAAVCGGARFTGEGRLPRRPMDPLIRVMREHGVEFMGPQQTMAARRAQGPQDILPLDISREMKPGVYNIEGNISSQYISGLLFALPLLPGESRIRLLSPMESSAYVDMTLETLAQYGIRVEKTGDGFLVPGDQIYRSAGPMEVEGDWSNAAFFLAAGAVGAAGEVAVTGLNLNSAQGDMEILKILERFGAEVTADRAAGRVTIRPGAMTGTEIDVSQIPDLMPVLAVTACRALGPTVFCNAGRLRLKESDRIASTAALIRSLGGRAEEGEDSLTVYGNGALRGGRADSFGDHRIAMSAAVAALFCQEAVLLSHPEAVEKSYPNFFRDYVKSGGKADVV